MKAERIHTRKSKWGEGPVWWKGHLYYVDINGRALVRLHPETAEEKVWDLDQRIGFALPCEDGRWIWGGDTGFFFLDLETGESTAIFDPEPHIPDNRFNDAGISPDGRLFAGTIAMTKRKGSASLYRMDADLSCEVVYPNVTNSNGIAWSPDGSSCYYIDTPSYQIRQFDYDPETGNISNERIRFHTETQTKGVPDGLCVDADGNLWIAFCHGACVVKFDPTGRQLAHIDFPRIETTSCCFGGDDFTDLYVTTGISATQAEDQAGQIFVVRNAGKGQTQTPFTGQVISGD